MLNLNYPSPAVIMRDFFIYKKINPKFMSELPNSITTKHYVYPTLSLRNKKDY